MSEKKLFAPRTYEVYAPRDMSKRWFVFYYQDGVRIKAETGINKWKTAQRRMKAAKELIKKIKADFKSTRVLSSSEAALRGYLEEHKGRWSKATYEEYVGINDKFCDWLDAREVSEGLVRSYMAKRQKEIAPATYTKLRFNLQRNLIGIGCPDYFEHIPTVQTNSTPLRYYQEYQSDLLGEAIKAEHPELWLCIKFIFYTFIRPKELRFLRAGDILLDSGDIRVPSSISKNKKTQFVAIPDEFLEDLEFIRDMAPGELIFKNEKTGKAYGKGTMYYRHKRFLNQLNFGTEYSLYSWKHTGAVTLAKAGVSLKEIQIQMRHHSLDQTDQYLRQLGVRDVEKLRKAFPRIIDRAKKIGIDKRIRFRRTKRKPRTRVATRA